MEFCKHHPLQAALYRCGQCATRSCASCVDEGRHGNQALCMVCDSPTDYFGTAVASVPFWRRLDEIFRYPLATPLLIFLAVVSLLEAFSVTLPLPLMVGLNLLLTGVMIKYCFNCLSETAGGNLQAPAIVDAYEGGVALTLRLLFMLFVIIFAIAFVYSNIGPAPGALLGIFFLAALPAVIIIYAMTESMIESLNPVKLMALIGTIGSPYALLLAILMIMIFSVGILSELIGYDRSLLTLALQSVVSNFYLVVMFHLMGYMIYQYQSRLGQELSGSPSGYRQVIRGEPERLLARIRVKIREGDRGTVRRLFERGLRHFGDDKNLRDYYFKYVLATLPGEDLEYQRLPAGGDTSKGLPAPQEHACRVVDDYLAYLLRSEQKHQLRFVYAQAQVALPDYRPSDPEICHALALACHQSGNPGGCVKMLVGLHRRFPHYAGLVPAYETMLSAMRELPELQAQLPRYQALLAALRQRAENTAQSAATEQHSLSEVQPSSAGPGANREAESQSARMPPPSDSKSPLA